MPPELNDQMVTEPSLGDEDLQQWLTSIGDGAEIQLPSLALGGPLPTNNGGGDATDDEPDDALTDDGDEPPEGSPTQPEGGSNDHFTINGQQFAREDIERLYNFDQYMRANPDVAQRVNAALTGQPTGTPAVPTSEATPGTSEPATPVSEWQEPTPPDFLDLEDPAQKFSWDTHVATQKALHERDQQVNRFFQQQAAEKQNTVQRQAQQDMASALTSFTQAHPNLNEDDIAKIRIAATPFVDGMMKQLPPVDALVRSMEVAAVMDNDLREKVQNQEVRTRSTQQQSRHRKARLGEISGSPRSAPRTEPGRPAFTSDKEFLNALASEFSEQMQR